MRTEEPSSYYENPSSFDECYSRPLPYKPIPSPAATKPKEPKNYLKKAYHNGTGRLRPVMTGEQPVDTTAGPTETRYSRRDKRADSQMSLETSTTAPTAFFVSLNSEEIFSQKPSPKNAFRKKAPEEYKKRREKEMLVPDLSSREPQDRSKQGLNQVFELLHSKEWERKAEGLKLLQARAEHQPEVLLSELLEVCRDVVKVVKNLSYVVSRTAMTTMAYLYTHLKSNMDKELEETAGALLHKAGEVSIFLRDEVKVALGTMVENCSKDQVLDALTAGGFSHKNAAVKACMALHLEKLAQSLGASCVLTENKEFTIKFLNAVSKLAIDAAQDVRRHA